MMPGSHSIPPNMPHMSNRRQNEYHYQYQPQPHPYAGYQHPHYPTIPHAQHYPPQQWYQPYAPPQQYSPAPRQFHPPPPSIPQHHAPVIVSSHHQTPQLPASLPPRPVSASHNSPVPQSQTPQPASSTPSVTSHQQASPATPTTSVSALTPPPTAESRPTTACASPGPLCGKRVPFYPPLPWYSSPGEHFPARVPRRRKRVRDQSVTNHSLELPTRDEKEFGEDTLEASAGHVGTSDDVHEVAAASSSQQEIAAPSVQPSQSGVPQADASQSTPKASASRPVTRAVVPIPITPKAVPKPQSTPAKEEGTTSDVNETPSQNGGTPQVATDASETPEEGPTSPPPAKAAPKSWADLVRTKAAAATPATPQTANGSDAPTNFSANTAGSLAEAIRVFSVESTSKISFLEPRGLVNTGNMCYMNSILQVLVFCIPFYDFLDQVGKKAVHNFKSDTPLLDAMIMFMREYKVIDSTDSVEKLRMRLKDHELEQYGGPFSPDYVYNVIRQLPRFSAMKRGHQQDAEEFLGLLLSAIHDECARALQILPASPPEGIEVTSPISELGSVEGGWLEVGPKQKASITRSSGFTTADAPTTKIFGGKLRSELRVPGLKTSVTLEPYQPLQLAISSPEVTNLVDALKGLTKPETLHGEFNSPRGPGTTATKQLFIESLPPVLIIHLKRFQYDNAGGAQKIWKKVGYPLELTVPKEVFPQHKRGQMALAGLPKYRLISVVYHHGKNINSGHYTVDVRRQDGLEWVRIDDTVIRRIRSEDVAQGGAEEDPKVLAKALEEHKKDTTPGKNIFEQFEEEETRSEQGEWNQVNPASKDGASKRLSGVPANGAHSPSGAGKRTPNRHENLKDKVAYLLVYNRIN